MVQIYLGFSEREEVRRSQRYEQTSKMQKGKEINKNEAVDMFQNHYFLLYFSFSWDSRGHISGLFRNLAVESIISDNYLLLKTIISC